MYSIIINFDEETFRKLNEGKYNLYCFLASRSPNRSSAVPLCWGAANFFLQTLKLEWENRICAFVSTSQIKENDVVFIPPYNSSMSHRFEELVSEVAVSTGVTGSIKPIQLKQRMLIGDQGQISVDTNNNDDTVLIQNNSRKEFTTGICILDTLNKKYVGSSAFDIIGGTTIKVVPENKIFLTLSTRKVQTNTVIIYAENSGILIDLTGSPNNQELYGIILKKDGVQITKFGGKTILQIRT